MEYLPVSDFCYWFYSWLALTSKSGILNLSLYFASWQKSAPSQFHFAVSVFVQFSFIRCFLRHFMAVCYWNRNPVTLHKTHDFCMFTNQLRLSSSVLDCFRPNSLTPETKAERMLVSSIIRFLISFREKIVLLIS